MSLTSLLEKITNRQRDRPLSKWSAYRSLVANICDGKEPDADKVATVLADNEKTLDELRDDAKLLARRRKLRAEMDAIEPLESEAVKVDRKISEAEQAFETMTAKHEEETSPLYIRRNEIKAIRKRAAQARSELRDSCEDRELVAAYESVLEDLHEAQHERAGKDEEITKRESWIRQDKEKAEVTPFDQERKRYRSQVKEHKRILADLQANAKPTQDAVHVLQERLEVIEDQLLEP
ncbi:hypothetical protein K227x_61430 [Rubripirellula lacrimiformis]|uniref:Uncharacterized protein n=1 Tax=Rubripirellula lacrimiformis TaxID=1930273 RepID=A0A517NKQ0_9BACT|nr:hypothetical protein [Rubripirellula lacrimiformis]QDT07715.1 hypothetical protein K227x_61430 [Rubripirellula lacrimiformis]